MKLLLFVVVLVLVVEVVIVIMVAVLVVEECESCDGHQSHKCCSLRISLVVVVVMMWRRIRIGTVRSTR